MSRGTLYELKTNPNDLFEITENDFLDYINIEADYFRDFSKEERENDIKNYLFPRLNDFCETGKDENGFYLILHSESKVKYFLPRFELLKQVMDQLTPELFIRNIGLISTLVAERYGDAVSTEFDEFLTFDDFMRFGSCDIKYYIGNCILMH